jgi:serine/threonine-protein kinase
MTYELLTGDLPVGKFLPPSRLVAGLDSRWDALVERCLEVDPAARPHSALELAHALEALAGLSANMELAPRTRRKAGKSKIWSWLGLGTAVVVLAGVVSLRIAQDHGAPHPVPPAARAPMKKLVRR